MNRTKCVLTLTWSDVWPVPYLVLKEFVCFNLIHSVLTQSDISEIEGEFIRCNCLWCLSGSIHALCPTLGWGCSEVCISCVTETLHRRRGFLKSVKLAWHKMRMTPKYLGICFWDTINTYQTVCQLLRCGHTGCEWGHYGKLNYLSQRSPFIRLFSASDISVNLGNFKYSSGLMTVSRQNGVSSEA